MNLYRISSARLQNWDYRWRGAYFITICTHNRECYFGEIVSGTNKTQLSPIGVIADILWHEIKNHTTHVELGEFVVMPNHIHGILILTGNMQNGNGNENGNNNVLVETGHALSLPKQSTPHPRQTIGQRRYQNIGKNSVSSIIGSYKSAVTRHAHRLGYNYDWQTRFYDHIIRNDESFQKISEYIVNNPAKWNDDKFKNE